MINRIDDMVGKWFALKNERNFQLFQILSVSAEFEVLAQRETVEGRYEFEQRPLERVIAWDSREQAISWIESIIDKKDKGDYKEPDNENAFNLEEVIKEMLTK